MYSITEGFSPILYCRPDVVTLGNPFDTMKKFCLYSQCSHLNLSTLFHLRWMLRRFRCVQIFLKLSCNPSFPCILCLCDILSCQLMILYSILVDFSPTFYVLPKPPFFLYGSMVLLSTLVLSSYNVQVIMLGHDWWLCMVINIGVQ